MFHDAECNSAQHEALQDVKISAAHKLQLLYPAGPRLG